MYPDYCERCNSKQDIKGVIPKQKIRQKRKIVVAFTFCP